MLKKSIFLSILLSSTFISSNVYANNENITVNSWDELSQHNKDYGKTFLLNDQSFNLNAGGFDIGAPDAAAGSWSLDGNNVHLTGNYQNHALAVMKNINSFVFKNMSVENFKKDGGLGGFLYNDNANDSEKAEITDSKFIGNGAEKGGVVYNNSTLTKIDNVVFNGNFVDNGAGGAIYNAGSLKNISNSTFESNASYNGDAGGIYNAENSEITNIENTSFKNNKAAKKNGGAIYNAGTITSIIGGSFIGNGYDANSPRDEAKYTSVGGAIYNGGGNTYIGTINSSFSDNRAQYGGGAILNDGNINKISGNFDNNYSGSEGGGAIKNKKYIASVENAIFTENNSDNLMVPSTLDGKGGAIYNFKPDAQIDNIQNSKFYANTSNDFGGAISNSGKITSIKDTIFGSENKGNSGASGGAINNQDTGKIETISDSVFAYNRATESTDYKQGLGGAIRNASGANISLIKNTKFINNLANGLKAEYRGDDTKVMGGAIYNAGAKINTIAEALFENNTAGISIGELNGNNIYAYGGAIYSGYYESQEGSIDIIENSKFSKNNVSGIMALGGAIYNENKNLVINNTSFSNNIAQGSEKAQGGAIWSNKDILIKVDNGESLFSGNYVEAAGVKKSNDIYMDSADLKLSSVNNGTITFDDDIDGNAYGIVVNGDGSGSVKFNNTVDNVKTFTTNESSVVHLGLNGVINTETFTTSSSTSISANDINSPTIKVDIKVDKANSKVNSGLINVSGDVSGVYNVIVNALNPEVFENASVAFLKAPNDRADTASSFSVARVIGSPYLWDGDVNVKGEESGSTWYLNLSNTVNPDYDPNEPTTPDNPNNPVTPNKPVVRAVTPEVIAGIGLHEAAIEQTRSVVRNVSGKVASGREYCPGCGIYPTSWDSKALRNVWVMAQGESADIDKTADMDAKIWGAEGGFDLQNDVNNTLGVFASYRKGEYDLSGKGSKYYSKLGSEIDIDSYLAGLYYRYDKNMNWLFATVYGGVQQADVKTDDGMSKFDSDGVELGAGLEAGHSFALSKSLTLDPSLGVYYTQISFDKAHDNVGKSYKWDDLKHVEAEAAVKLSQQFENAKVYVKPSLIQTYTDGDSVKISGLNKADTYHDQTLGRIEIGGNYGFTDSLNGYVWSNYTYGSSYDSTAAGLGINYAW